MDANRKRLAQFRVACQKAVPYMAHHVYGLVAVEQPGLKTMAVDKYGRLYWGAEYVASISEETGVFSLLHETLHVVLDHAGMAERVLGPRATDGMYRAWNYACDMVVNQLLAHWLNAAPEGIITHERFGLPAKLSAVQYYDLLMKQQDEESADSESDESDDTNEESDDADPDEDAGGEEERDDEGDRGAGESDDDQDDGESGEGCGEGDDADQAGDDNDGDGAGEGGDDGDGSGAGEDGDAEADADEADGDTGSGGSCSDGRPRSYELPPDPAWADREYSMADELESAIEEQEAKAPGSVPGELKAAVETRLRPQPDPFDVLKGMVARAVACPLGAPDYTLRRMSRRQGDPTGPRLRGIKKETPNCVVLLDTSGSMDLARQSELKLKALAVIAKAVSRLRSVRVICGDTDLHNRQVVTSVGRMQIEGGGGTDMGALVEQIDKEDRPDAIVVVTDCETRWCDRKPRARVVVAAVKSSFDRYPVPAWARLCDLTKGGA